MSLVYEGMETKAAGAFVLITSGSQEIREDGVLCMCASGSQGSDFIQSANRILHLRLEPIFEELQKSASPD